jgi:general secretion pathway protein H
LPHLRKQAGFTLVEILVVLVVIGIMVSSIQLNLFADDERRLRHEGERLAALLTALADESVTSGQPLAVSFNTEGYAFWERSPKLDAATPADLWRARPGDELFSNRELPGGIQVAEVRIRQRAISLTEKTPDRVVFSASGIHAPFSVLLAFGDFRVRVSSDALGNLTVADDDDLDADA